MKKTILATLITATSFASVAADVQPIKAPTTGSELVQRFNQQNADTGYSMVITGDEVKIVSAKGDVVLVNDSGVKQTDAIATARETLATHVQDTFYDEKAKESRQDNRQDARQDNRVTNGLTDIDKAIISAHLQTQNIVESDKLEKIVTHRMNNTHLVEFTNEQKLAGLNQLNENHGDGTEDRFTVGTNGHSAVIIDNTTGEVVTPDMIANAKKEIKNEAESRLPEGINPPVELDPEQPIYLDPIESEKDNLIDAGRAIVDAGENLVEAGETAKAQGQAQAAQQQAQIDEIYAQGQQNTSDIATLFNEVDRLDTRIDQTQALNAATVNARPMVTNGQTAFGAGVGYAGSEAAISVGVAHSFVDTGWSASGTLAASSDDVVIGAGTQYAF